MVTVELIETGAELDVLNGNVTYNKMVADFGDITSINASYSWQFECPKTPNNVKAFRSLGIAGDQSQTPYTKIYCRLIDDGVPIVGRGLLNFRSTGDTYKCYIQEGIIEFFKDIANDKIGEVIDLEELSHITSPSVIANSFDRTDYKYLIADYNGPALANQSGRSNISPNALVPSISVRYLWDKIFEYYGWTYENVEDRSLDMWLTYPNGLTEEFDTTEVKAEYQAGNTPAQGERNNSAQVFYPKWLTEVTPADGDNISVSSDRLVFVANKSGKYGFKTILNAFVEKTSVDRTGFGGTNFVNAQVHITINGSSIKSWQTGVEVEQNATATLNAGDLIAVEIRVNSSNPNDYFYSSIDGENYFKIEFYPDAELNFEEAFIDFKISDFCKEVMVRSGLTAFPDVDLKKIKFMSNDERFNAPAIDWTDKFVRRVDEQYTYQSYAQNNWFRHQYNEDNADYYDGNIPVANENLDLNNDVFQSKIYAPENYLTTYNGRDADFIVPALKMFDLEIEEDDNGNLIGKYKELKKRFYLVREKIVNDFIYVGGFSISNFPVASLERTILSDAVREEYKNFKFIVNDTRIHIIEVALSRYDVATLQLDKRYFFEQENNFYLLNKLTWKSGETCKAEFVRIKKLPSVLFGATPIEDFEPVTEI